MDEKYMDLINGNKSFVESTLAEDPNFFKELAQGQQPAALWIGCADSRVPANQVTNSKPGDIFVHRNIANLVVHTDINMLSVLEYAVNALKVKHVIVCGHYGCGGVMAAMENQKIGLIDNWLRNIKDVYQQNQEELGTITDKTEKTNRMVELNVLQQVKNLAKTSIVQSAWQNGQELALHGWAYKLDEGLIKELKTNITDSSEVAEIFRFSK